ncbi:MAG: NAD(P) transhydrogenase subunit beta, partial [Candidatus Omnitrophota bacterium]
MDFWINISYIVAATLFILGLKMLSSPASARKGNLLSAFGMFIAIVAALLTQGLSFKLIAISALSGSVLGILAARLIAMTAMPEMVALLNGSGGIASLFVGWSVYHFTPANNVLITATIFLSVLIGGLTFTGSIMAWGKLSEKIPSKSIIYPGQKIVNALLLLAILATGIMFCMDPAANYTLFIATIA